MSMLRVLPLLVLAAFAQAAAAAGPGTIYVCIKDGKRLTSDRPFADCPDQTERNKDGSVRRVVPPNLTADELAAREAREREEAAKNSARKEAERRDRELLKRYPNEAAHARKREAELEPVRRSLRMSEARLAELAKERKPLMDETEFYVGKPLPGKLKQAIDANDAAVEAQRELLGIQQGDLVRLTAQHAVELQRLKALWGGAAPGSLGPLQAPAERAPTTNTPVTTIPVSQPK